MQNLAPRQLFLIDGFGALLSAFLLGVVLVQLEHIFGIPSSALYVLAIIPCFFVLYDLYFYLNKSNDIRPFLKGIAVMNLLYCLLSIGFAIYHSDQITYLGWIYIVGEVIIVSILSMIELKIAKL